MSLLQDKNGKISGPRTVIAGFGAGMTESLLAVTPTESIKTQLFVVLLALSHSYLYGFSSNGYYNWATSESMTGNPLSLVWEAFCTAPR